MSYLLTFSCLLFLTERYFFLWENGVDQQNFQGCLHLDYTSDIQGWLQSYL